MSNQSNKQPIDLIIQGYTEALLWSSTDDNGEPLDSLTNELSIEAKRLIRSDCDSFLFAGNNLISELPDHYQRGDHNVWELIGHDFWLTRNGHGVGFWDRGLGDLGDRLTELSKTYGEQSPVIGDDEFIYLG